MNDRYLYRAKHIHALPANKHLDVTWIEGYLCNENYIYSPSLEGEFFIDPSTICQCTGLEDKNDKLIWENDIVIINGWIGKVMWSSNDTAYIVLPNDDIKNETYCLGYWVNEYDVEVIGNEIDNPELLEVGE